MAERNAEHVMLPGTDGVLGKELARAIELVRIAGAEVLAMQRGKLDVEMKPGDEPVTVADRRGSEIIVGGLAQTFPDHVVVCEELEVPAEHATGSVWFVDPIDGTKDFIRGEDGYSVMLGLVRDGRPVLGCVYQPAQDRLFYAVPEGAWVAQGAHVEAMRVSEVRTAGDVRLVASKSHRSADIDRVKERLGIRDEVNIGSVGVKLCLIALGVHDLYVNPAAKTKAWDTCAPEAILVRAGGRLTDLRGGAIEYGGDLAHRRGLVASNGRVHDEVLAKLQPLFPAK